MNGDGDVKMEEKEAAQRVAYMWGYLPGALQQRTPLLSPTIVRLLPPFSWMDVCGGGCGFAMAISEASKCRPSGKERGKKHPPGSECDTEGELCCIEGKMYKVYKCSPRVTKRTNAYLTLKSFEEGGDGGSPSKCDNRYHPDDTPAVALSTGWFHSGSRCFNNITIRAKGRSVVAMVVDECDSSVGCDAEHDYQPPCANNIVFASRAVWKALGVSREDWGGLDITWSDA